MQCREIPLLSFSMEMSMLVTSVQHGGFTDMDGVVHRLVSESRQSLLGVGAELAFPFFVSSVLSLFKMPGLLKHSSLYCSQ